MDDNSWSGRQVPMGGDAVRPIEPDDWRAQLPPDSRHNIVNHIMNTLKKHLPFPGQEQEQEGLQELKKIAVRLEENIYFAATSQSDYLRSISSKMLTMVTKSQSPMANSLQTNASSNSSDLACLDSTTQTGNTGAGDWQEEVYQKIRSMKDMYLLVMNEMHVKIATKLQQHETLPQQLTNLQFDKLKFFNLMLEHLIQFVQLSKNDIQIIHKDKLGSVEKQITSILYTNKPHKIASLQPGQLPPPHMFGMQNSQLQSQISHMQAHENQMNPLMQPMNMQTSAATMAAKSLQQNNTLSGQQHVNLVGTLSSQTGVNTLQSNLNSLPINSSLLRKQHLKRQEQLQVVQSQQMKRRYHQRQMQHRLFNLEQQSQQQMSAKFLPGHTMSPIPSPQFLQAASPQVTLQPSPQMDQQNLMASFSHAGNSPFIIPSPSTPLAPSQVNSNAAGSVQSLAMGTPGMLDSPLLAEFLSLDIGAHGNSSTVISGRSNTVEHAIDQLIKGLQKLMYTEEIDLNTVAWEGGGLGGQAAGADEDMNCI